MIIYLKKYKNILKLLPVILSIGLIPLLVRLKLINIEYLDYIWSRKTLFYPDFDFYYKSLATQIIGIISFCLIVIMLKIKKIEHKEIIKHKAIALLLALCFFTILSFLFSENKYISLWGMRGQMEGVLVYLSYFIIAIYTSIVVNDLDDFKTIIKYVTPFIIIMLIIGVSQMVGSNLLETGFGKMIIVSKEYINDIKYLNNNNQIYLTISNPNYVGSYVTLLSIIIIQLFFYSKTKIKNIFYGLCYIIFILMLFSSKSRAGYIGVFISLIVWGILSIFILQKNKSEKRFYYKIFFAISFFIIIFFATSLNNDLRLMPKKSNDSLGNIITKKNEVLIQYKEKGYYIKKDVDGKYYLYDEFNNSKIRNLQDFNIQSTKFEMNDQIMNGFILTLDRKIKWYFFETINGYKYLNSNNNLVDLKEIECFDFKIDETIGSNRIYIWSRSLPLLKKSFFIGYGPGMFTIKFPQTDYVGKFKYYGYGINKTEAIIDKPHNIYLQYGINLGVVALLLYITLNLHLIFKLYSIIKKEDLVIQKYAVPLISVLIGYAITSVFNDSSLGVSTIYWSIIGLSMALVNI